MTITVGEYETERCQVTIVLSGSSRDAAYIPYVPYCTILYHTYHTVPYCIMLYHTVSCCIILYHTVSCLSAPYVFRLFVRCPYVALCTRYDSFVFYCVPWIQLGKLQVSLWLVVIPLPTSLSVLCPFSSFHLGVQLFHHVFKLQLNFACGNWLVLKRRISHVVQYMMNGYLTLYYCMHHVRYFTSDISPFDSWLV